jgi:hypothetical protein
LQRDSIEVQNRTTGAAFKARHGLSERQIEILRAGGALNAARKMLSNESKKEQG